MIDQINLKKFKNIYDKTYNNVLKFVVCKCSNMEDVNDIIQEIYISLYKKIEIVDEIKNIESYIIGIAKKEISNYYGWFHKFKTISLNAKDDKELEFIDNIPSEIDIEKMIINNVDLEIIWEELKKKKMIIQKIFYLYYNMDFTIKEIANVLDVSESYIKNCLYRTLKELREFRRRDGN